MNIKPYEVDLVLLVVGWNLDNGQHQSKHIELELLRGPDSFYITTLKMKQTTSMAVLMIGQLFYCRLVVENCNWGNFETKWLRCEIVEY